MSGKYSIRNDLADTENIFTRYFPTMPEARQAKQFALELPPEFGDLAEGKRDAARHMYWMAESTRQHSPKTAEVAGWLNETAGTYRQLYVSGLIDPDSEASRRMDEHNNSLGVQIGTLSNSPEMTKRLVLEALKSAEYDPEARKTTSAPIYRRQPRQQAPKK